MSVAVHPNGRFVYVADANDGSIHAWNVNETTGVPTQIAAKVINESGSFFTPSAVSDSPTHVITITPNGNFLYATNNDAMVSAYSIGANGALTHIGDLNVGASNTGAITANNDFAWVTDTNSTGCGTIWNVMTMRIGANGALTNVSTTPLAGVFCWLWSISVSPDGRFVQVGDEGGDAQVYSFTVGANGSLTQVGPQVILTNSSDARDISFSPDGKFFYVSDDDDETHAVTQNANGSMTELATSPYSAGLDSEDGQIVVDLTGKFVYVGGQTDGLVGYTRNAITGALTQIGVTATANGDPMGIGIVR
jgi:6-phosphogluconolactonase (cycloisomerase 2 family)